MKLVGMEYTPSPVLCGLFLALLSKDFILAVLLTTYVVHIEEDWDSVVLGYHGVSLQQSKSQVFNSFEGPAVHRIFLWTSKGNTLYEIGWAASSTSWLYVLWWWREQLLHYPDWWGLLVSWQIAGWNRIKFKLFNMLIYACPLWMHECQGCA